MAIFKTDTPPGAGKPRRIFKKPFNPVAAIIEYLHIVAAVMALVVVISVPFVYLKNKPGYSTEGMLNINPYLPKVLYDKDISSFVNSFSDWMRTQIRLIVAYPVMEWAIKDYEAKGFKWRFPGESMQSAAGRLGARLKVAQVRDTQLITISSESPRNAGLAELVNSVMRGYLNSVASLNRLEDSQKLEILHKERIKVEKELEAAYFVLEEISLKYGTAVTDEKYLAVCFEALAGIKGNYNKVVADRIRGQSQLHALKNKESILKRIPLPGIVADRIDSNQAMSTLINTFIGRVQELREQMVGLTEDNPRHILIKRRLQEIEPQIELLRKSLTKTQATIARDKLLDDNSLAMENIRAEVQAAQESEPLVLEEMKKAQKEILEFNTAVLRSQTKRQEIQRLLATLGRIGERIDQIQMEFSSPGRISVVSWALKPEGPNVDPRTKMLPLCFIAALLAGVGTALVRDIVDNRIKRPADVEKTLGFPLTGFVLRASEEQIPADDLYMLHRSHPGSFMVKQIVEIAVKIDRERLEHGSKIFSFIGLGDGVGVTMLAMNVLAMSSTLPERRLYLDLNTRHPAGSREPLRSALRGAQREELPAGFLDGTDDKFPFTTYPCGAEQRMHFAQSTEDLRVLLDELKESFDLIVLDLPPIILSADTQAVVPLSDVALLVVMARHSIWGELMRSVSLLDDSGVKAISVVLNRVGFVRGGYFQKTVQAYHKPGGERARRSFGIATLRAVAQEWVRYGVEKLRGLSGKRRR